MANIIYRVIRRSLPLVVKQRLTRILLMVVGVIAYGTIGFHFIEGQPWIVSLYWTFVTIGTVGYGDYSPETSAGMIFTITLIVFGIGTFALAIEAMVDLLLKRQQMRFLGLIRVEKSLHVVICGWTESTLECIKEIGKENEIFILDEDETVRNHAIKNGASFVHGDPTRIKDLEKANVQGAKAVIVDLQSDSKTIHCILGVRELDNNVRIIAEVERYENIEQVKMAGASQIISPFVISGRLMYKSIDDGYEAMFVQDVLAEHREREMREVKVNPESKFVGKTILEADIHEKTGVVMVGIGKQGKLTIDPPRDFIIEEGDIILGIGKKDEFIRMEKECLS
jgi:voltage-gated potassium channel